MGQTRVSFFDFKRYKFNSELEAVEDFLQKIRELAMAFRAHLTYMDIINATHD
ncbi:hypothetical protein GCM10009347_39900 [Shewanella algicola]|nr:hypothetical protein GCM10009347_39900 [Shewanella algicola]